MQRVLIEHIAQIATPLGATQKRGSEMSEIHCIEDGAIYIEDDRILKVGSTEEVKEQIALHNCRIISGEGKCAVPGFVDSHTHFVFGGYRPKEFLARLKGAGYLDIMKMGGGIQATVEATRKATKEELLYSGRERLQQMLCQGVTTVEGKSGYGLDMDCEIKQLEVMKQLNKEQPITIVSTYLGGHAVPEEYRGKSDDYLDWMVSEMLPKIKKEELAKYCDIFCEDSVFSLEQSEAFLKAASDLGFCCKMHADEIVSLGGASAATRQKAVSADHLLMISDQGIADLKNSQTMATLLPATAFCLNKPFAPARRLIDQGCAVALASDFNPGSCFADSIPLIFALAVIHMDMSMEEALCAITLNGAATLGMQKEVGSIEPGKKADINLLSYPAYEFLVYHTGANIVDTVIKNGVIVYEK